MADNIITPDDMPRPVAERLAVDHARHGTCFYRWREDFGCYERIAPVAVEASAFSLGIVEAFLAVMAEGRP